MSSKKSQTTNSTSTATTDPYAAAAPGINTGLGMAGSYLADPNSQAVYGGQRVADLSANTQQGMAGLAGNAGYGQATDYYQKALGGDYLSAGNPYIQQVTDAVNASVMPGINATFGKAGMTGSTIHQNQLASGIANATAPYLFDQYNIERGYQNQAAGMLPSMLRQQSTDQLTAGSIQDQQNQNVINAAMQQFEQQRTAPIRAVGEAMPYLLQGGSAFGTRSGETQNTTTTSSSPFETILGGAMMGLGALSGVNTAGMFGPATAASAAIQPAAAMPFSTAPVTQPYIMGGGMPSQYPSSALQYGNIGTYY